MTNILKLRLILPAMFFLAVSGCSINKMAMKAVSNALTKDGSSAVFTSDSDPELIKEALPFTIKMYESLLSANPEHQGLYRMTGSLYVMYANAFVQKPAEQLPRAFFMERQAELARAKSMYIKGQEMLYRGLELKYPGFSEAFAKELILPGGMPKILLKTTVEDVTSLYWAAVGGISAFSLNPMDIDLSFRVPEFLALINRAYELDPDFNSGALDDFLLLFYASMPESMGGDKEKAEIHYKKALEKSNGLLASPYVSYAQAVSIPAQDYDTFKACLEAALAIDPDADPPNRLVNIISQRKAKHLLNSAEEFFFNIGTPDNWDEEDWNYEDW